MTYHLRSAGNYGVEPVESYPCQGCGRDELHSCGCPNGPIETAAYLAAWREWVADGDMDVPEDGDPLYAAGFERVVNP